MLEYTVLLTKSVPGGELLFIFFILVIVLISLLFPLRVWSWLLILQT